MTNFERIKNMSIDEAAKDITKGISSIQCDCCIYGEGTCNADCCYGIVYWLNSEVEE